MRKLALSAAAMLIAATGNPASAATVADFELNGSLANSIANGVTLTNNGATLGAQGITFGLNQGPTITGLGTLNAYTIDVGFTIDQLNGPRGNGYVKLIDFSNLVNDAGYYSFDGYLNAFPLGNSPSQVFSAGTPVRLTLSRDEAGLITAYINGDQIYSRQDPGNQTQTMITSSLPLTFFTDDTQTSQGEASPGFVDYIRIADTAVTPAQITPAGAVPEPASWGIMIVGMGAIGFALRRRVRGSTTNGRIDGIAARAVA